MFKLEEQKNVKWPVTVNIPRDGGRTTKAEFTAHFELLPQTEFREIYEQENASDEDLVRRVLTGWDGVADADGQPIEYNEDAREMMIRIPYVRAAMVSAYLECSHGKAARKN